jgi:hypothetical protein
MVQRISPSKIVTVTKDGECHLVITLELNINLMANGQIGATLVGNENMQMPKEDVFEYSIPDFTSGMKLDFGKIEK